MKDVIFDEFQSCVEDSLIRHKSLLDILSKLQESESRLNRAVTKAVTNCGCVKLSAEKQVLCSDKENYDTNLHQSPSSHITGNLCENCVDIIESELGNHFFYLFSLCNTLNINLYDTLLKEYEKISMLGKFTFR